jgi:hypothetical protein
MEWVIRLGTRFALRCFQRLSDTAWLPGDAPSDNRYTIGCDPPFLSYRADLTLNHPTHPKERIQPVSRRSKPSIRHHRCAHVQCESYSTTVDADILSSVLRFGGSTDRVAVATSTLGGRITVRLRAHQWCSRSLYSSIRVCHSPRFWMQNRNLAKEARFRLSFNR